MWSLKLAMNVRSAVLVTVVQEREFNEPDQRGLELAVKAVEPRCRTRRYTLPELARLATLDEHFVLRMCVLKSFIDTSTHGRALVPKVLIYCTTFSTYI